MTPVGRRTPRVAVVANSYYPRIGGAERYHQRTARALSKWAEVEIFTARPGAREGFPPTPPLAQVEGLPVHYLPWIAVGGERLLWPGTLGRTLRRYAPDLLWANLPSASAAWGARHMHRIGRPWIATYHGDLSRTPWRNRVYARWEAGLLRTAAHIFVHTDRLADRLVGRGFERTRITAVPVGPLIGEGEPPRPFDSRLTSDARPGAGAPLLFVGGLDRSHAYKGVDRLLSAARALARAGAPVNLVIVGGGPLRERYEAMARSSGLATQVRFLGTLSDLQLAEVYRTSWALVVPSTSGAEGFGAVAAEAAWYGCPSVISSSAESANFWRESGCALVYDDTDPEGLSRALHAIWSDQSMRHRLAASTPAMRESLDWGQLLPRTIDPILRLLDVKAPRPGEG